MKKSIYEPLKLALQQRGLSAVSDEPFTTTFAQIEKQLGRKLPHTAYGHDAWWANNPLGHAQARAWLEAGFEVAALDRKAGVVTFKRRAARKSPAAQGLEEEAHLFRHGDIPAANRSRHPAFGALKGTFTIAPGTDLTAPVYSDEEWAEIEKEMEEDWDEIARGMRGQK